MQNIKLQVVESVEQVQLKCSSYSSTHTHTYIPEQPKGRCAGSFARWNSLAQDKTAKRYPKILS